MAAAIAVSAINAFIIDILAPPFSLLIAGRDIQGRSSALRISGVILHTDLRPGDMASSSIV
jgi:hypothetical protein